MNTLPGKQNLNGFAADTAALQRELGGGGAPADTDPALPPGKRLCNSKTWPHCSMETTDCLEQLEDDVNTQRASPGWCGSIV